jgi:hypothetical protein
MKQIQCPFLVMAMLLCCSLISAISAGTALESYSQKGSNFLPNMNLEILSQSDCYPVLCAPPKHAKIHGPDTRYYRYTVNPESTEIDITLQWYSPQEHNALKLQNTASNEETFGPCDDADNDEKNT